MARTSNKGRAPLVTEALTEEEARKRTEDLALKRCQEITAQRKANEKAKRSVVRKRKQTRRLTERCRNCKARIFVENHRCIRPRTVPPMKGGR